MPAPAINPLSKQHLAALNHLLQCCPETGEYLRACADCGLAMDDDLQANEAQLRAVQQIKAKFFPQEA